MKNKFFAEIINMMVIIQEVKVGWNEDSEFDIEIKGHNVEFTFGDVFDSFTDEIVKRFAEQNFELHFDVITDRSK